MLGSGVVLPRELSRFLRAAFALLAVAYGCVASAQVAQVQDPTRSVEPNNYPAPLPRRKGPPPARMSFSVTATIALAGRLSGEAPSVAGSSASVPLVGATATTALVPDATARIEPAPQASPAQTPEWVVSSDGARRFRTIPTGGIEGDKRCRHCAQGWKRDWTLAIPAPTPAPPILRGRRIFFGAGDDRVYCLRADNGHRVWAVDVGDRVSRPLAIWIDPLHDTRQSKPGEPAIPGTLVLVATDGGGSLLALDPYDGARIATYELPAVEGRLATPPVTAEDGAVLVGRERYRPTESDLFVLALGPAPPPEAKPDDAGAHGRLGGPFEPSNPSSDEEKSRGQDRPGEREGPR
jgi:hypothetical protein